MRRNFQALGRLPVGVMNKTEAAYAEYLETLKCAGEIQWYKFEAIKLRLADNCFYSPDFLILTKDKELLCHEVKGFWTDDARVKIKVAAAQFPIEFVAVRAIAKKLGGGWEEESF
jgi:Protein of unknown function (DUF1064)